MISVLLQPVWAGCVSFFSVIGRGCTLTDSVSTDMLFIVSTKQKRKDTFVLPLNDCVRYETLQANITDCTELKQSKHTFRSYCNVALQTEVLFCTMGCLMLLDLVQGKNEDSRPIIKGFGFTRSCTTTQIVSVGQTHKTGIKQQVTLYSSFSLP